MAFFIFKMIWREARGSLRHFLSFLFSIALGVGSIVAVGIIAANLEEMTFHEARNLLTADLEARLRQPLSPEGEAALADLTGQGIRLVRITEMIGMAATDPSSQDAPQGYQSQLVELKAVEPGYPFYGRFAVDPPTSDPFQDPEAAWVQEGLLIRLGLQVGDRLKLGEAAFTIKGVIRREPDRAVGTFTLGPRVMLSQEGLARTKLVQTGSRINRRILFQTPEPWNADSLKTELEERWASESVRLKTYRESQPRLGRFLENFTTYLGLVGLITLMIGGIAVASNIHAFLTERIGTIAILKSLGSPAFSVLLIYLLLAAFLGAVGSLLGVGLGVAMYQSLLGLLTRFLPPGFAFEMSFLPIFRGVAMGVGTTILFSLWPLQKVWRIAPSRVFRQEVEDSFGEPGRGREAIGENSKRFFSFFSSRSFALGLLIVLGWAGLSIWQAGSWRLGSWVIGGVASAVVLLLGATWGALRLIRIFGRPRPLIFRYGIGNLTRPGRQIMTVVLSIGIGVLILLTLLQVEKNLLANLQQNIPDDAPSLFFIDLQPDQKEPFEKIMAKWDLKKPVELTPLVRSRLFDLNGQKVSEIQVEERPDGWYFTREYVLTYQQGLPKHNTIRKGEWWEGGNPNGAVARISAEAEAARHLGIGIGSKVTFDIQGVPIEGEVTSIRDVDWGSLSTNFFFIFEPGALDGAPITYVATATTTPAEDLPIQNAVIRAFPNVTVIHLREILETIAGILREITRTVRFMALFGFAVGLIVLSGAIAATRARRLHEMTLFKTLGATRPTLLAIMAVEYGLLGLLAAAVGGLLSIGLSWGIVHFFLDLPWRFDGVSLLQGVIATLLLTLLTGFLMTYRILGQKPLAILRAE
ncbi:ABC transporter permease [Candidatus Manganitrophus noduliformans]|uniref:FtsX-like permease family protein n=1 Tax=Candidatus Manganitrophus noduliformans TaxID=2606439 RepID=A0A7X6DRW7_9BACT|nr:FtsX-like permease family protein [Candidatus Manganitrophus noduliformans]NKE72210.1 FtsX-like permease family protein [Candidatus Manganitrophus noduliformans]